MISEKVVEDQNLDVIQELLSYMSSLSPQKLNENFGTPLYEMDPPQSIELHNEGEKIASLDFSDDTEKVQLAKSECDSAAGPPLLSRQSSLIEEWFGSLSSTHPNDICVDSSLEALFAGTEWQDFKVEMPAPAEAPVTENRLADPSVLHSADNIPAEETVELESLPMCSAVRKTEPVAVPENLGECSSQRAEVPHTSRTHTRRKRRISSESRESYSSDVDSQSSLCGESSEDLARFAQKFLSDGIRVKPYFWQYNAQSRGPKAQRLCSSVSTEDSHVVPDFTDPVFCPDLPYPLSHSGKARQGDGNDPRPDPQKLLAIGCCIWRLEAEFKSISAESAGACSSPSLTSQRKNQLASRICRLKKKALHAANKIKLDGLKQEHDQLMRVIKSIADQIDECIATRQIGHYSLCQALDRLVRTHLTFMIAGNTADYVNSELEKVAKRLVSGKE